MKYAIVGNGGLSRELKAYIDDSMEVDHSTYISKEYHMGPRDYKNNVFTLDDLLDAIYKNPNHIKVILAVSDVKLKQELQAQLPDITQYFTYVHPSAVIYSKNSIGKGCIIAPNVLITTNVTIGNHCLINANTSIGHDTIIKEYCTLNPGVAISGNCTIEKGVFFGTNSSIREKLYVAECSTIGMGSAVVKDIKEENKIWVGIPASILK